MRNAIVLAAGKGTRMHSDLPKVLHKVGDTPMVEVIVRNLKNCGAERVVSVVGYGREAVMEALEGQCEFAVQEPQLGTGHAVMQAKQLEEETGATLVVNGDAATIQTGTLSNLYASVEQADMAVLTVSLPDAGAYGRVIRNEAGDVLRIVEFKDCTKEEAQVHEINTGIYAFNNQKLFEALKELTNDNAQKEYYITDLVEIFRKKGWRVTAVQAGDVGEVQGVNDCVELARANHWLSDHINTLWMKKGVQMADPSTAYIGPFVTFGTDCELYPNVYLYGDTIIGNHVTIMPGSFLRNVTVRDGAVVSAGVYENTEIA
ncbi:MAG: NTP transferase domain-containing protein [Solobacterium sp.]|nr:NTP transferase domain-containing protein [Solobacterium sp.]